MSKKFILPVIHHLDQETSFAEGILAMACGADGVFLISHSNQDDDLFASAKHLKETLFPEALIGLNLLGSSAIDALRRIRDANLDMVWCDAPGVTSQDVSDMALDISHELLHVEKAPLFFGSVAFKYQPYESQPTVAAIRAFDLGMLPTTSGTGTGSAPSIEKIKTMHAALTYFNNQPSLAVASGMTPENVGDFLPFVSHFLVATGISKDSYHLDPEKLKAFVAAVRNP